MGFRMENVFWEEIRKCWWGFFYICSLSALAPSLLRLSRDSRHWWHPVGPSGVTLESQWIIQTESPHLFKLKAYVSPLIESSSHKNVYFIKLNDKKWLSYVMIRWYIRFSCNLFWFIKNKQFKYVLLYIIFLLKNLMCLFKMQLYIIRIYVIYLFIK